MNSVAMVSTIVLLSTVLGGCVSTTTRAALDGKLQGLQQEIAKSQSRKPLRRGEVERLAWAVAGRELLSTTDELAVRRVAEMRPCVGALERVLWDRAERLDDAGAEATIVLLDTGRLRPNSLVERYRTASSGAWRAVAARGMVAPEFHFLRRQMMEDPDERVRQRAFEAARSSPSEDDLEVLLEAARLDPNPANRDAAIRAIGALGGERAVLLLLDRWAGADELEKLAIVAAWATPSSRETGGLERLFWVVDTSRGMPSLAAADALAGHEAVAGLGTATLARAVRTGTTEERRFAIERVRLTDPDGREAVEEAAKDTDQQVRVMALARLLANEPRRATYQDALRKLARSEHVVAYQARAALAAAGDDSIEDTLRKELRAPRSFRRLLAARGLIALGEYSDAAIALADDDPRVRANVACSVLADARY